MVNVELTRHLHAFFPQLEGNELAVEATTIAEVVAALEERAPGFIFYICDERGRLRTHVNVFIGDEMIVDRQRLADRVPDGAHVFIAQALSGG